MSYVVGKSQLAGEAPAGAGAVGDDVEEAADEREITHEGRVTELSMSNQDSESCEYDQYPRCQLDFIAKDEGTTGTELDR